jgi:hypothetical protein
MALKVEAWAMNNDESAPVYRLRADTVTWRDMGGEVVALDLEHSQYLGVNAAGRVLWVSLASGATEPQMVAALSSRFGIDQGRAQADVAAFLRDARSRGLLEEHQTT